MSLPSHPTMNSFEFELHKPAYHYDKLANDREFRTLTILEDDGPDQPVRCRLAHHPLPSKSSSPLEYDAVSWHWGESVKFSEIVIVGLNGAERILHVRPNLVEVLRGLRRQRLRDAPKDLWIDAVCINQEDKHEKDLQVQLMFEIYSNARSVSIWLGTHADNSELALKFMKERVCDFGSFEQSTEDESTKEEWKAFAALLNRKWFSRRWVVQELALAKHATVYCGDHQIDWTDFETAVALFERDAPRIARHYKTSKDSNYDTDFFGDVAAMGATRLVQAKSNLFRVNDKGEIIEYRFTLSDLVSNLSSFEAKEPHDLIYAILSLAKDTHTRTVLDEKNPSVDQDASSSNTANSSSGHFSSPSQASGAQRGSETTASDTPKTKASKRRSTVEIDGTRLTKAQKLALDIVLPKFKQSILPENVKVFPVNYKKEFFEVCKEFLNFTIPKMQFPNLDILCRPWAPKEQTNLPSWIPSVANAAFGPRIAQHAPGGFQTKRKNADPLVGQTTYGTPYYNACHGLRAEDGQWRFGDSKKGEHAHSLFVTGFVLDKIGDVEDASQNGHVPLDWLRLGDWEPWNQRGERDLRKALPEILWRTLVADRGPDGGNTKEYYRRALEYAVNHSTSSVGLQTAELKQRGNAILVECLQRMEAVVWNRRLFKSERDRNLGLAPKGAKAGDYVCILRGCSVPVVLRRVRNDSYHTFVGECYLHTMMNGRAIDVQEKHVETLKERIERKDMPSPEEELIRTHMFELR